MSSENLHTKGQTFDLYITIKMKKVLIMQRKLINIWNFGCKIVAKVDEWWQEPEILPLYSLRQMLLLFDSIPHFGPYVWSFVNWYIKVGKTSPQSTQYKIMIKIEIFYINITSFIRALMLRRVFFEHDWFFMTLVCTRISR